MRLRTQLTLFFILMMGSVLGVGILTVWGGIQIVASFSDSLLEVEKLSHVRGLQNLLARERSTLSIFRQTGDPKEWERLSSLNKVSAVRFKEMAAFEWAEPRVILDLVKRHGELESFLKESSPSIRSAGTAAAARILDAVALDVNDIEMSNSEKVRAGQRNLRTVVDRGAKVMFGFIFWQILLGFLFALSTFRSLHKALVALQEGAEAFGQGRFDYRIDFSSADEFGDLARSFNRMAENVRDLEVKTVHMHRMSAVGQLAGGVAHEINNPLTGVLGQAQILLETIPAEDPRRANVEKIERAAIRCRRIVRSLLDFSRQKETRFAQYDLHEAVDGTLELCETDFQNRRIQVIKNLSSLIPPMTGNAAQLQQVFLNLASNAVHAMSASGGVLTVATSLATFAPPGAEEKVDGVEVSFQDNGSGIDPYHLPHIFEPFFTTKEIGKGTGLGLSVSLSIVRNHGGDLQVESEGKGKGALFRVLLPFLPPARMDPSQMVPRDDAPGSARYKS